MSGVLATLQLRVGAHFYHLWPLLLPRLLPEPAKVSSLQTATPKQLNKSHKLFVTLISEQTGERRDKGDERSRGSDREAAQASETKACARSTDDPNYNGTLCDRKTQQNTADASQNLRKSFKFLS